MSTEIQHHKDRYDDREMVETIRQTVCKGATDAQLRMFIEVCRSSGMNPFLKEIWFVAEKSIIMAGRDAYLRVANEHPQFDGIETRVERDEKGVPVKAVCTVWRKDRGHPTICEAYYSEYRKAGPVWSAYPSAMIGKVAEVLALKRSFAINGVVSEEELAENLPVPRGSKKAAADVADEKINSAPSAPPLVESPAELPSPAPADPLESVLATFANKAAISAAFAELKKAWLKYEGEEAWRATLEQFQIEGENYRSFGNAKRCFTTLWNATEKMMTELQEQPA